MCFEAGRSVLNREKQIETLDHLVERLKKYEPEQIWIVKLVLREQMMMTMMNEAKQGQSSQQLGDIMWKKIITRS